MFHPRPPPQKNLEVTLLESTGFPRLGKWKEVGTGGVDVGDGGVDVGDGGVSLGDGGGG